MKETMIYHYCSESVFNKIIETQEVWLSDITKMNDKSEYRSGYGIIREVLKEFGLDNHDIVSEMSDFNLNQVFYILIGCFSSNGDLKSQWSEYADQGKGVSIGFSADKIKQHNLFNRFIENGYQPISSTVDFIKVNYDENLLREHARAIIKKHMHWKSEIKWRLLSRILMRLSIGYKDKFFSQESEIRAVVSLEQNIDDKYKVEQRQTNYGEASFHRLKTSFEQFHAIEEVIIGPKSSLARDNVESMLEKSGIDDVLVKLSVATGKYR